MQQVKTVCDGGKKKMRIYPDLAKVAWLNLCCPLSNVPSEQLFSSAGLMYDAKRMRLLAEKAEPILFLLKTCLSWTLNTEQVMNEQL